MATLHKKLTKRQREWAWALLIIVLSLALVWWYGSSSMSTSQPIPTTLGTVTLPVHTAVKAAPVASVTVPDTSVAGVIAGIPTASTFNNYIVGSGLSTQLQSGGPYTIFVPVNSAFASLAAGSLSGLSAAAQKRLIEYHIVAGVMLDTDALMSGTHEAMSKDMLNFSVNLQTGASYVDSGMILKQYKAQNGVVYLISAVLMPPAAQ